MEKSEKKIYAGNGKFIFDGKAIKLNVCLTDIPEEFIKEVNGKRYANLLINKLKEDDKFGNTHSITVDTYKKGE